MFAKFLLTATAIGAATAKVFVERDVVEARQTSESLSPACESALSVAEPAYDMQPTLDIFISATKVTEPCKTPFYTGSVGSIYTSYSSELMAWYTSNSVVLNNVLTACSETLEPIPTPTFPASCSTFTGGQGGATPTTESSAPGSSLSSASVSQTGSPTVTPAGTTTGTPGTPGTPTSTSATTPTGAASRETGFAAAALAAAGFIGAVAML
ncbi:hypothetical protein F4861DRAFT_536553 [Xylaria intraflava]|nr:hypothetical protein F4861DRAFT_536553 [Xylaria intraflava]